jgi:hypothetical protein
LMSLEKKPIALSLLEIGKPQQRPPSGSELHSPKLLQLCDAQDGHRNKKKP